MKARNLAAMWGNFRAGGAQRLIASGVIENPGNLRLYVEAVPGLRPFVCRLRARGTTLRARIERRGREHTAEEIGKLHRRALELSESLESDGVSDLVLDTDERPVPEIARTILRYSNWLPVTDSSN